ncbi:hypothetical protein [Bradyrhizobium sp. I1.7.5]|uniref:hypothetical protein n=1 Tax=Bradyrhizobium sp. I1.7.5 TaxID=3156363 RepID=UPI003398F081
MGTKLPLYGYIEPTTTMPSKRKRSENVKLVSRFLEHLSRPSVQHYGLDMILEGFHLGVDPWTCGVHLEMNSATRPTLEQLIDRIGSNGTIVIPTVDDFREVKTEKSVDLVERILVQKITVLAVGHEEFPLDHFVNEIHPDAAVFHAMSTNVLKVRSTLERFVQNRDNMKFDPVD